jgi:anti-sigma factor RsiW
MKWLSNKCRRYEKNISLLATGDLAQQERAVVEAHLAGCPACRTEFEKLRVLSGHFTKLGTDLPDVEPSPSLRRRWMVAVTESSGPRTESIAIVPPTWLSGQRAAWGSLAAVWALVLFFRLSAPEAPKPAVATVPISLREVLLALKTDPHRIPFDFGCETPFPESRPDGNALPQRSQREEQGATTFEVEV